MMRSEISNFDDAQCKRDAEGAVKIPLLLENGFLFPHIGGCIYEGRKYTQHALERMAPCTPEIVELLLGRALKHLESAQSHENYETIEEESGFLSKIFFWWEQYCPLPRGILPEYIDQRYDYENGINYHVVLSDDGDVITVFDCASDIREKYSNPLIQDARNRLKRRARQIEEKQHIQEVIQKHPNVVHHKLQREERVGRVMNNVRKLTPSLDEKAKDWQYEMNKAKAKRNNKVIDISDIKASRKAAQLQAKSAVIKSDETKSFTKVNNTITVNKADMCPINSSNRVSYNVTTMDVVDVVESAVRTSTTTVALRGAYDEVKETYEAVPESWEDAF